MNRIIKIAFLFLCAQLAGCCTLSSKTLSLGLREQYIEMNSETSNPEYSIYEIKEAPLRGEYLKFYRESAPAKQELIARYQVSNDGSITALNLIPPPKSSSIISKEELNCIKCIKPKRYRKPAGYLAYPLMAVAAPLDLAATAVVTPVVGSVMAVLATGMYVNCLIHNIHPCHE